MCLNLYIYIKLKYYTYFNNFFKIKFLLTSSKNFFKT